MHRFRFPPGVILVSLVVAVVAAAGVAASIASSSGQATKAITPSPVFTAQELSKPAGNNWYAYYGALTGQRYSSLKQITTAATSAAQSSAGSHPGPPMSATLMPMKAAPDVIASAR